MSIFGKSATVYGAAGNNIVAFPNITAGPLPLPANIVGFQLSYGTNITMTATVGSNLSNITFTVIGKFNNITVTESLQGPDADGNVSVQTKYYYDKLISIVASADSAGSFSITVNVNSVIVFNNMNSNSNNNYNLNKFSIRASSLGINEEGWAQANYFIYGVVGEVPSVLADDLLLPNLVYMDIEPYGLLRAYPSTRNFYFINDPLYSITQNDLQNGYVVTTEYPFDTIIVNNRNNLIQTPTLISITQS